MEPVFGGLLIEAYCHAHKEERLDPSVLVARAREALEDGPPPLVDALDEMEVGLACFWGGWLGGWSGYGDSPHVSIHLTKTTTTNNRRG